MGTAPYVVWKGIYELTDPVLDNFVDGLPHLINAGCDEVVVYTRYYLAYDYHLFQRIMNKIHARGIQIKITPGLWIDKVGEETESVDFEHLYDPARWQVIRTALDRMIAEAGAQKCMIVKEPTTDDFYFGDAPVPEQTKLNSCFAHLKTLKARLILDLPMMWFRLGSLEYSKRVWNAMSGSRMFFVPSYWANYDPISDSGDPRNRFYREMCMVTHKNYIIPRMWSSNLVDEYGSPYYMHPDEYPLICWSPESASEWCYTCAETNRFPVKPLIYPVSEPSEDMANWTDFCTRLELAKRPTKP